ncbi:hypothetical protein GR160_12415 [Flavobacterium sp. Sd200]|uniref:hypothetical protein n=1 Tax=Flavobacterium sp. Sd200 TaxID=2692211 RepID=UPI00136D6222|nr:hypothetical protein [Flavobacterium sp. Sd200]MXN92030.1 hypothetical protein [Flavobacterium sp. Sd200]
MKSKGLILLIVFWIAIKIINYYFSTMGVISIVLFFMFIFFFIMSVVQIVKLFKERKQLTRSRIEKVTVYNILLIVNCLYPYTYRMTEKVDWYLQYNKRMEVVEQVRNFKLSPNTENKYYPWCKLPYNIPVVSNDGNKIVISRENSLYPKVTVGFIIYTGAIDIPSTMLIYSDDPAKLINLEKRAKSDPDQHWKIEENWYRSREFF